MVKFCQNFVKICVIFSQNFQNLSKGHRHPTIICNFPKFRQTSVKNLRKNAVYLLLGAGLWPASCLLGSNCKDCNSSWDKISPLSIACQKTMYGRKKVNRSVLRKNTSHNGKDSTESVFACMYSVERLFSKGLFPYNPAPLVHWIVVLEDLYEGNEDE